MDTQHDTENVPAQQPLRYPRNDAVAQLGLLEDSFRCVMDLIAHQLGQEQTVQLNPVHTNALLVLFLNQIEHTKTCFQHTTPSTHTPTAEALHISRKFMDQSLDSLILQINNLRTIATEQPIECTADHNSVT